MVCRNRISSQKFSFTRIIVIDNSRIIWEPILIIGYNTVNYLNIIAYNIVILSSSNIGILILPIISIFRYIQKIKIELRKFFKIFYSTYIDSEDKNF